MADGHAKPNHDYHLVDPSPWPIVGAFSALATAIGAIMWMAQHKGSPIYGQTWGGTLFFIGFAAILGVLYAVGFLGIMGLSSLFDGGTFARLYLVGGTFTQETVLDSGFQTAMWVSTLLYLPLSALFWHAPALVHWHSQPAVKSIFFSLVACLGNWRAMGVYLLTWFGLLGALSMGILLVATLADSAEIASVLLLPLMLLSAAMFFTSSYFTFRDSFVNDPILA